MSRASQASASSDEPVTPVIRLVPSHFIDSTVTLLQNTLEYCTSPTNYLIRRLGKDVFEERSHLLSIPSELIDRDTYGKGVHKQHFEQHIATLLGKKHGLFFITGVQAQLTAMKIHCNKAGHRRVAWHYLSHPEAAEGNAYAEVFQLQRSFIGKSQLQVPTVEDVRAVTELPVGERPAAILLELPNRELGCKTYPFEDLVQISKLCKAAGVKLHMDGARLWEIQPFYEGKSFADIAGLFDSVYVSFYKGLRGAVGAMLTSPDEEFIEQAKVWQRRLGGNMVTSYSEVIDDERGFNLNIGTFDVKRNKMRSVAAAIMKATEKYRTKDGKPIVFFNPPEPTCCQVHTHIQGVSAERLTAARDEVEKKFCINVFPNFRPWTLLDEMDTDWTLVKRRESGLEEASVTGKEKLVESPDKNHQFFEWYIGNDNVKIADDVFAKGWAALCQIIAADQ